MLHEYSTGPPLLDAALNVAGEFVCLSLTLFLLASVPYTLSGNPYDSFSLSLNPKEVSARLYEADLDNRPSVPRLLI